MEKEGEIEDIEGQRQKVERGRGYSHQPQNTRKWKEWETPVNMKDIYETC